MKRILVNILYKIIELIEKFQYRNLDLDESDISKKIIESYDVSDYQVTSDTGLVDISSLHITQPYIHYRIDLGNGMFLECADNHIIFDSYKNEIFVKDVRVGDLISTSDGDSEVVSVEKMGRKTSMADLTVDHPNHRYYTNGILSHNTVMASIYILHFMLFNNTKNILLAANVLDTSKEVLDKIKEIYGYLPFFLQQGVDVWSVTQIKFQNKCRAKAFAMTKTASIGNTGDLVYVDEFAYIGESVANKFYKSVFPTLANVENSKMIITSTPNGYNLFHKLLTDSERDSTDPLKNGFGSLRVYWYQVPGRNVSYLRINPHLLPQFNLTLDDVLEQCNALYNPNNKVTANNIPIVRLRNDYDSGLPVIDVQNSDKLTFEMVCGTEFTNRNGDIIHSSSIAQLSSWKLDATKNIGGEDNFNSEYDLRFSSGSKSVLSEHTMERLLNGKKEFEHFKSDIFKRLRWDYSALKFIEGFDESTRKNIHVSLSIDISEGLGQDYSVINMFKLGYKSIELIEEQKDSYKTLNDFFQLTQFGIFRTNVVSHEQLAEMAYLLIFEYFDPDKVKVTFEYNNDGKTFLSEIKNVFENNNDYSGYVMLKFKHRIDALKRSYGLKVGPQKNQYVKDYQDRMENEDFIIHNETNINEVSTFIKHTTNAGNTVYKGDGSCDDTAMTLVNMSQAWKNVGFKELIDDYHESNNKDGIKNLIENILSQEIRIGTDYDSFFKAKNSASFVHRTGGSIDVSNLF